MNKDDDDIDPRMTLRPNTGDKLHALQLARDLAIVNERNVHELGPLPAGGLPVQAKRKPNPLRPGTPAEKATTMTNPNESPRPLPGGLPSPPVPQRLREMLKDYPEHIQRLQEVLDSYMHKPSRLMPFDGAIWALEGRLETFISEARDEVEVAEASGDAKAIARAKEADFMMGCARHRGMHNLHDLHVYFQRHERLFK